MADLKLGRIPDRVPVKLAISVSPELHRALQEYADAYEATYGQREAVPDLIPFMLAGFLDGDREFQRARAGNRTAKARGPSPST
jgi:hypothetical protein